MVPHQPLLQLVQAFHGLQMYRQIREPHYRRRFLANRDDNLFMGIFDSFEAALANAPPARPTGYDNAGSAAIDYSPRVQFYDYPALFWLSRAVDAGMTRIFDLGGHTGIKYHAFRPLLSLPADHRWTVCDLPAVVERGQALVPGSARCAAGFGLDFTSDWRDMDGVDVLFASGSLQYLPDKLEDLLGRLDLKPRRIVLNITAVHPVLSYFTLNSIGTAFCAYRVQSHSELVRGMGRHGYGRTDSWENIGKSMTVPFHPEHGLSHYSGFCFDLAA
jgi:putative methyltransferase (TIGR04325 family)